MFVRTLAISGMLCFNYHPANAVANIHQKILLPRARLKKIIFSYKTLFRLGVVFDK